SADVNTNGGTTPGGGRVAVDASFTSTNFIVGSGTKLSNYILPTTTSITSNANIYGVLGTDHVTLDKSNAVGIFASANAGNNIAVALSGFGLVDTTDS